MHRPRGRAAGRACVAVLASALLLAGCGTVRVQPTASGAPPVTSPTPSANEYVDSIIHTKGLATAAVDVTVDTQVGDMAEHLTGTGYSSLDRGFGDITWTATDGAVTREVSNGKGLFVQDDVPDGMWAQLAGPSVTRTGRLADPLRGLGTLAGLTDEGPDTIDGQSVTRYSGRIAATPTSISILGLPDDALASITGDLAGTSIDVTVWIDGTGHVVRVDRSYENPAATGGPVSARTSTLLSDFMVGIELAPPPTESVKPTSS